MTGIEMLRSYVHHARAYMQNFYINNVADINAVLLYEKLRVCFRQIDAIADQIECEIDEAVADEVAGTLSAYEMNTNARWHSAVAEGAESDCKVEYELISRYWLPRPRFEDGEPVKVGDRFLNALGRECVVHSVVSSDAFGRRIEGIVYASNCDCHITVGEGERVKRPEPPNTCERPEPPDTWERIEDDIVNKISPCEYFGWSGKSCCDDGECPVFGNEISCTESRASDLVRRAKKLAGVEE